MFTLSDLAFGRLELSMKRMKKTLEGLCIDHPRPLELVVNSKHYWTNLL